MLLDNIEGNCCVVDIGIVLDVFIERIFLYWFGGYFYLFIVWEDVKEFGMFCNNLCFCNFME